MNHSPSLPEFELWLHPDSPELPPYVFMSFGDELTARNVRQALSPEARRVCRLVEVTRRVLDSE